MTKTWATRILLAFAIFTLGFGVGKEVGRRQAAPAAPAPEPSGGAAVAAPGQDKVIVYYLHTTFRCVTCNSIEAMAKDVVETDFAEAVAAGRIEWREADFQVREDLAKRYDVTSSCVVVARERDGKDVEFQRLDNVWTLFEKPAEFNDYIASAIRKYLE
ncbi:MAG: hypothetical protein A3K19_29270 [Lentisphaerae bacterium RIFOXYB12_FULL_65_16]|nr:MAG: hypothetical protein A3K18_13375 [Lentisphaerae bacterium RIFOXYA12_64_32]OGV88393.1 MAG: hypothetical protein A3K19_29270 [Lentisphaerae bacterium RIFOXYB12_FULL_65_16]